MAVDCTDAEINEVSACKNCGNNPTLDLLECKAAGDVYGVCDGHGICGHDVSNFVREMMPKLFLTDPNKDRST